ncbi:MAG: hypothetical protein KDD36_02100 [Flavobacteriales bacterium]|nr:hypothetical protein [Flavobacteriales bacterium]
MSLIHSIPNHPLRLYLSIICFVFLNTSGQAQIISLTLAPGVQTRLLPEPVAGLAQKPFEGDSMQVAAKAKDLLSLLFEEGYLTANAHWSDNHTTLRLSPGQVYSWASLSSGNIPPEALYTAGLRKGTFKDTPFKNTRVADMRHRVLGWFEDHGYPFATVFLDSIGMEHGKISAILTANKGPLITLDSIIVKSEDRMSYTLITAVIQCEKGDLYNESVIRQIDKQLNQSNFLRSAKPPEVLFMKGKTWLYVYPAKKKANRFDGIIGMLPDEKTGKVRFTGDVHLKLVDALSRGESLILEWQHLQPQSPRLKAEAAYPYLFHTPFGMNGQLGIYKKDTTFLEVRQRLSFQYALNAGISILGFAERKSSSTLTPATATYNQDNEWASTKVVMYGLGIQKQVEQSDRAPVRGFFINLETAAGKRSAENNSNTPSDGNTVPSSILIETDLLAGMYHPIYRRHIIHGRLWFHSKMSSQGFFTNEMIRFGGMRTLRGFDEESILASTLLSGTIEYRYMLEESSYLYLFADRARYEANGHSTYRADDPYGFGAGISFATQAGIFTINYALGKQLQNPVSLRSGKIHFGLVNIF